MEEQNTFNQILSALKTIVSGNLPESNTWMKRACRSQLNIENCGGTAMDDPIAKVCAMCVSVNQCIYYNQIDKRPKIPQHPHCKCNHSEKPNPTTQNLKVTFEIEKITKYLFVDESKKKLFESMGYTKDDAQLVYDMILTSCVNNFCSANYELNKHNIHGQRITIPCTIMGKGVKLGRQYSFVTGWVLYPDGIKNNTPFGGKIKE
ncbi:MAG: hypothetical protein FWD32_01075 [Firmicutes bacterium]|nr:hypothetical protein [Bacillota bacterium]